MTEITMKQYNAQKKAFNKKHWGSRGAKETGHVNGEIIYKTVSFEDGHTWEEVTVPVYEVVEVKKHNITIPVEIKFYRTEVWDSENSFSRYLYEKAWT